MAKKKHSATFQLHKLLGIQTTGQPLIFLNTHKEFIKKKCFPLRNKNFVNQVSIPNVRDKLFRPKAHLRFTVASFAGVVPACKLLVKEAAEDVGALRNSSRCILDKVSG